LGPFYIGLFLLRIETGEVCLIFSMKKDKNDPKRVVLPGPINPVFLMIKRTFHSVNSVKLVLLVWMTTCSLLAYSDKVKGRIIFKQDTLNVTFNISPKWISGELSFERLQQKIKYIDVNGKKKVLLPDQAREIQFEFGAEKVRMISVPNTLGLGNVFASSKNIFLRIIVDGRLKLFNYYFTQRSSGFYSSPGMTTGGFTYSVEKFILQNEKGELKRPSEITFRKDMAKYFSDCPDLVEKIESKDFRKNDMEFIVKYYNSNCR
jgi:hypothetical protein